MDILAPQHGTFAVAPDDGAEPALLAVSDLSIAIDGNGLQMPVVRAVALEVASGETLAIVGESGSGKSLTGLAIMGLLAPAVRTTTGSARLEGEQLLGRSEGELRRLRGARIAMIFQDPALSLNPVHRIGDQVAEAILAHRPIGRRAATREAVDLLRRVGIPDPGWKARSFPHELSGGQRQRVMIAIAIANDPALLIADEPTTALDVTVQAQIVALLQDLQRERGMGLVFITHNLPLVAEIADRVVVMYAGEIVEEGPVAEVFAHPRHPYTRALIASAPAEDGSAPQGIPGMVPPPHALPPGCLFAPRCARHVPACDLARPALDRVLPQRRSRCIRPEAA